MKRLRSSTLFLLLAMAAVLAQTGDMVPPEVRRVGDRLACLCRSCKNTVATCQMLGCHYTAPARERIIELHKKGLSDDAIVADFVEKGGKAALSVPPAEGFNVMAWLAPPLVVLLGMGVIGWYIKTHRTPAAATPETLSETDLARYKAAAERELSHFDE
jgi:cytochrome c-type biogenesis protein CcmH